MRRVLKTLLIVVASGLALMVGAGLVARSMVSGSGKDALLSSISEKMGVPLMVAGAEFDLAQWFRLQPAVSFERVTIGNPRGFRGRHLLEAKKLSARVSLLPLLRKRIEAHSIEVREPRILVESNAGGETNLGTLVKKLSTKETKTREPNPSSASSSGVSFTIDSLAVTSGTLMLDTVRVEGIDLQLRDLSSDRACSVRMGARLFGGKNSRLRLEGHAGPFAPESLPVDGALSVIIAPAEIPASLREQQFGKLLGAPGEKGRVGLEGSVNGDLFRTLTGPAKLVLSDILIGKDEKHVLPLGGEVALTLSGSSLMAHPGLHLKIPAARLRLGKGEWSGEADLQVQGGRTTGSSKGAIRGVETNELASSLTAANEKIYGRMEMPAYSIHFAGRNAQEVRNSLSGSAKLSVANGRVAALDILASIQQALERSLKDTEGAKGSTPFTSLASDLDVGQSVINWSGVLLESPVLRLTGRGVTGYDESLNFDLNAEVTGGVAQLISRFTRTGTGARASIPLVVTGTLDSPRVRPNVGKMATGVVQGVLDSLFKKPK